MVIIQVLPNILLNVQRSCTHISTAIITSYHTWHACMPRTFFGVEFIESNNLQCLHCIDFSIILTKNTLLSTANFINISIITSQLEELYHSTTLASKHMLNSNLFNSRITSSKACTHAKSSTLSTYSLSTATTHNNYMHLTALFLLWRACFPILHIFKRMQQFTANSSSAQLIPDNYMHTSS